jgi:hypothetical protein
MTAVLYGFAGVTEGLIRYEAFISLARARTHAESLADEINEPVEYWPDTRDEHGELSVAFVVHPAVP